MVAKLNPPAGPGALAYLRKLPPAEVLKASPEYGGGGIGPNADGYVVPDAGALMFAAGRQHKLPLMIGNNARERRSKGARRLSRRRSGLSSSALRARGADCIWA